MADGARQLSFFEENTGRKPVIEGAFDAYVAPLPGQPEPSGPLPVLASGPRQCEQIAARVAGVPEERVLCLPARSWDTELMAMLEGANERAELELVKLKQMHARILGCSVEELDQRMEAEKAKEQAARAEARAARSVSKSARGRAAPAAPAGEIKIGQRALSDRQRELLGHLKVENNLAIYVPKERIADWDELKRVMLALGGEWKRGSSRFPAGFRFPDDLDAAELVRLAIETGEILDAKAAEFFPTPDSLADVLCDRAELRPGMLVLEPSAGEGALVRAAIRACPELTIAAVEPLDSLMVKLCAREVASGIRNGGLNPVRGDFLLMEIGRTWSEPFDRVLANPPFSKRQDIKHVTHALQFLKPGGILVAIMSAGVRYRDDKIGREFRALVERNQGEFWDNPENSFAESGTSVRTCMVRLRKGGSDG
jgi:predicted RNA methylase